MCQSCHLAYLDIGDFLRLCLVLRKAVPRSTHPLQEPVTRRGPPELPSWVIGGLW